MKDLIVTNDIKMEIIKYFGYEKDENLKNKYLNEMTDDLFKFYYYCKNRGLDACDADRYASLNTMVGCNIGFENFKEIDRYVWCEKDYDLLELPHDKNGKEIMEEAIKHLNIDIDLSNWEKGSIEEYKYYI